MAGTGIARNGGQQTLALSGDGAERPTLRCVAIRTGFRPALVQPPPAPPSTRTPTPRPASAAQAGLSSLASFDTAPGPPERTRPFGSRWPRRRSAGSGRHRPATRARHPTRPGPSPGARESPRAAPWVPPRCLGAALLADAQPHAVGREGLLHLLPTQRARPPAVRRCPRSPPPTPPVRPPTASPPAALRGIGLDTRADRIKHRRPIRGYARWRLQMPRAAAASNRAGCAPTPPRPATRRPG